MSIGRAYDAMMARARSRMRPARARTGLKLRPFARWTGVRARFARLARRHAQGTIETDALAVKHRVLADVHGKARILARIAETRRERHRGGKRLLRLL